MKRLVVVVVGLTYPYRGGIAQYTTRLCRELGERHQVHCINYKRLYPRLLFPGKTQYDLSQKCDQIPNERLVSALRPCSWFKAARRISQYRPDLVLIQWWHPFFALMQASLVRMLKETHVVIECHNIEPHEPSLLDRHLTRLALRSAQALIVHSRTDEAALSTLVGPKNIFRLDHPVYDAFPDTPQDRDTIKQELGIPREHPVLLFFGYVRKYKGLGVLLEALTFFKAEESPHLIVAGEFYEPLAKYQDYIESAGLNDRVKLVAEYIPNEQVARYFRVADALVLPYLSASQSGVMQIARAFQCPVVASRVGGLPDLIDPDRDGFLVEPNEPRLLFEALAQVIRPEVNSRLRQHMESGQVDYSWERYRLELERIYTRLTERPA
ncbi:glycosyltransferase [bacterium]|nr:glycosyltransferase [bacterium]